MGRVIFLRVLVTIPVLFATSLLVFFAFYFAPGSAAVVLAGGAEADPESIARARALLGLDDPALVQYWRMISNYATGDFGKSYLSSLAVGDAIMDRIPATLSVASGALVVALVLALPAGMIAAIKPNSWIGKTVILFSTLGISTPEFFIGVMLIATFALWLGWLPAVGYEPLSSGFWPWASHLWLPWLTLGVGSAAQISRHLRAAMRDILLSDYMRTAKAKGLLTRQIYGKHALKNAAIPVITVIGLQLQGLLSGSVIVETVFAVRGLGSLLIYSINNRDVPMIQGIVLLMVVVVVLVNLLVDILYVYLNPKVSVE